MARFPNLSDLATATPDQVLHLWSGLGYYGRARNLHKSARIIQDHHQGSLPTTIEKLIALPGIGRSTAGAILSLALGQKQAILDGNVKRVLARYFAIGGWPEQPGIAQKLWAVAEEQTPAKRSANYNQAIMDLGASLCSRSNPNCTQCPLNKSCIANLTGKQSQYPGKKPRKKLPEKSTHLLLLRNANGEILLEKRPPSGIWGGLWCCPETELPPDALSPDEKLKSWLSHCYGLTTQNLQLMTSFKHRFTHFQLQITPWQGEVMPTNEQIMEPTQLLWYNTATPASIGLAKPTIKLLNSVTKGQPYA